MGWDSIISSAEIACKENDATVIFLITDKEEDINLSKDTFRDKKLIVGSSKKEILKKYENIVEIPKEDISGGMIFRHFYKIIADLLISKNISDDDRVLVVFHNGTSFIAVFDIKSIGMLAIRNTIGAENYTVLEGVVNLLMEIAEEGREGKKIGTIFTIGDENKVLSHSSQLVVNPFYGHPEESRNVFNDDNRETFKEFSMIDGAFVLDSRGIAVTAGTLLDINVNIAEPMGLGSRHVAAATISKLSDTVAVVLSSSGNIRVYYHGDCIHTIGLN